MKTHQQHIILFINDRLSLWARWYTYHGDFGLGYPHKSREAQLIEGGGLIIRSTASYAPSNEVAEEIEFLVNELAEQNRKLATTLREEYFGKGNIICKAKRVGVPVSHYKLNVEAAKQWLIGRLTPKKPWVNS